MSPTDVESRHQEARVRRLAREQGYRVWKVAGRSRWYARYGPFALVHIATTGVAPYGADLDELERFLQQPEEPSGT